MKVPASKQVLFLVILSSLFFYSPHSSGEEYAPDALNMCVSQDRRTLFSILNGSESDIPYTTGLSSYDATPDTLIYFLGQNLDKLPPLGLRIRINGLCNNNGNCFPHEEGLGYPEIQGIADSNGDFTGYYVPFDENQIPFKVPPDWILSSSGQQNYKNLCLITQIELVYKYPDSCEQVVDIYGGLSLGYNESEYCDRIPSSSFVYRPTGLTTTQSGPSGIEITWNYYHLARQYIDGFKFYMHWCQNQYEDCDQINPEEFSIGEMKAGRDGVLKPFWEDLKRPDGQDMRLDPSMNSVSIAPNNGSQADPQDWSNSTIFLAVTAVDSPFGQSEPAVIQVRFP